MRNYMIVLIVVALFNQQLESAQMNTQNLKEVYKKDLIDILNSPYFQYSTKANEKRFSNYVIDNPSFDINTVLNATGTALMNAVDREWVDAVKTILTLEPKINIKNKDGNTALLIALMQERPNIDIIRILIEAGANPYVYNNKTGKKVYDYVKDKPDIAKVLKEYDVTHREALKSVSHKVLKRKITEIEPQFNQQALSLSDQLASFIGPRMSPEEAIWESIKENSPKKLQKELNKYPQDRRLQLANVFLEREPEGYGRCAIDEVRTTPLIYAVEKGYKEIARILIDNGADVNYWRETPFPTPLFVAVRQGNLEMVKLLLENGAQLNIKDDFGKPPLAYASPEIVKLLIDAGANEEEYKALLKKENDERKANRQRIRNKFRELTKNNYY